jgi:hypothetical protein
MVERRLTGMIAAAAVLIVLFIFWDAFRPKPRVSAEPESPVTIHEPEPQTVTPPPPTSAQAMPGTTSQGTAVPAGPDGREPSYIELLARSETRRRIRASGSSTYLGEMIAESGDSMLRRWENRQSNPIRVWFAPTNAANFKPAFLDAIRSAFGQWTTQACQCGSTSAATRVSRSP